MDFFCSKEHTITEFPERKIDLNLALVFNSSSQRRRDWLNETCDIYNTAVIQIRNKNYEEAKDLLDNYLCRLCAIILASQERKLLMNNKHIFCVEWSSSLNVSRKYMTTNIFIEKSMIISLIGYLYLSIGTQKYAAGSLKESKNTFLTASSCFRYLKNCNEVLFQKLDSKMKDKFPMECTPEFATNFEEYSLAKYGSVFLSILFTTEGKETVNFLTRAKIGSYIYYKYSKFFSYLNEIGDSIWKFRFLIYCQMVSIFYYMHYNYVLYLETNSLKYGDAVANIEILSNEMEKTILDKRFKKYNVETFNEILVLQLNEVLNIKKRIVKTNDNYIHEKVEFVKNLNIIPQAALKGDDFYNWYPYKPSDFLLNNK